MKKAIAILLALAMLPCLFGCGKKTEAGGTPVVPSGEEKLQDYVKVNITKDNFDQYFSYREYISYTKGENSNDISSAQISYGYELREGFLAADPEGEKSTLELSFAADGVVYNGSYTINFETLEYSGTTTGTESKLVTGTLGFWPQGGRTVLFPYGVYRDTYVIRLENFRLTNVSGTIYLLTKFDT